MRRRGPGIAGLRKREEERSRYRSVGADLSATKLAQMEQQLSVFRSSLESFALKHRDQVRRDPYFRAQFHAMCAKVGVDPLASNKGAWAEALGLGYSDFFFELAVAVAEAGLQLRERQWGGGGGLVALDALVDAVRKRRGAAVAAVTEDDIVTAIKKLQSLDRVVLPSEDAKRAKAKGGGGESFRLVTLGGRRFVQTVPGELNGDADAVLAAAAGTPGGCVTLAEAARALTRSGGGNEGEAGASAGGAGAGAGIRAEEALAALLSDGQAMVDDGHPDGARRFWFPCLKKHAT